MPFWSRKKKEKEFNPDKSLPKETGPMQFSPADNLAYQRYVKKTLMRNPNAAYLSREDWVRINRR